MPQTQYARRAWRSDEGVAKQSLGPFTCIKTCAVCTVDYSRYIGLAVGPTNEVIVEFVRIQRSDGKRSCSCKKDGNGNHVRIVGISRLKLFD
jgi:hypothetical protein